jgi:hypothetical protein
MIIFFSFMMSTNAVTGVPSKVLGDLSKNTVEDNGIRLATSRAVDTMLDPTRLEGKVTRSKIVTQKNRRKEHVHARNMMKQKKHAWIKK